MDIGYVENVLVYHPPVLECVLFWLNGKTGPYHSLALRETCRSLREHIPGLSTVDKGKSANNVLANAALAGDILLCDMTRARGA